MIENKIFEIIEHTSSTIIILKGFDVSNMPLANKYFSFDISYFDKIELSVIQEQVVDEMISNRSFDLQYKWMTIEEYQLFKTHSNINKMPVVMLVNNLFDKQFPYRSTLSSIESIYHYLYYLEDKELEPDQEILLENVSFFYGQIDYSKDSGNYYVTYPEIDSQIDVFNFYEERPIETIISDNYPSENILQIELSDNELPFLDLETRILYGVSESIVFILSGATDNLPYKYLERLNILKSISNINIFFTTLSIKRNVIQNEKSYAKILKDVYGFDDFWKIPFYKNIESHSKETVDISQAQIIDDIITQAEKAMHGESFRDIYITASTGAGKSVMFQIPAMYLAEKYNNNRPLTLVITPLIGLMNDQVDNMCRKGVSSSATINGKTPPFEKEKILEKVKNQEVNVLYLSPETLQARSDVRMLIGDRIIGVVIIDEAHIVTTWGKSFRADYWYLGIYLAKLRKERKEENFPIVTFTATSIYGGREDMYLDTRNSLNMISPISYFGVVRRDDIHMCVRSSEKDFDSEGRDYRKTKNALALKHLQMAFKSKQKSLIYFPTIKLLIDFYNFLALNDSVIAKLTGKYYGTLSKEERDEVLIEYKSGELQFVLATKAFGMGIDIPDITNVYHYAPTGSVVDYIQEIGRAARDKSKVQHGFGIIDFLSRDMNEVKKFYGMSAIRKTQILEVMRKVLSVYKQKGNTRNLVMSPEDFKYIFVQGNKDEDSLDNKVKTVLLMIEKDFSSPKKIGYSPFVARPRSLFGNDLIFVSTEFEAQIFKSHLGKYFTKCIDLKSKSYSTIYQVNLSGIWEAYYKNMTFPSFKYALFNQDEREKLQHKKLFENFIFASGIEVTLRNDNSIENLLSQYKSILETFENFINEKRITGSQFNIIDLGNYFMKTLKISDKFEARSFAQTMINSAFEFGKIKDFKFITERANSGDNNQRFIVHQEGDVFTSFILNSLMSSLKPGDNYSVSFDKITSFLYRSSGDGIESKLTALGIGDARNLLSYQVIGGNNPQIYLRINSVYPLERAVKQGDFYQNHILEDIQKKHYTSVEMMKYLFTKKQPESTTKERIINYTKWFWDNIEEYFMGILPIEVQEILLKK